MTDDKAESDVISTVLEEIEVLGIAPLSSGSSSDKSSHAIQIFNAQDIAKTRLLHCSIARTTGW